VNTLAFYDGSGPFIRVLIDPTFWHRTPNLPATFEGYRVLVERRGAVTPFH